ncbi:diguanylate cyclase [Hydrogenovibrio marinus]|uniref:diguanylate cyclase n=1 Tax=Hydrogenovibrio marinus TaxID=28885 RepID=A0A066ZNG8_HYDMR|nr:diguanylate cyclase [Hydrogenovibrio marinus]KDN95057.1 diguanylate cyclase [Hydrogenovibrio marinus]BBN59524.1 PleD family two-component system response regulator [Hydrogenovibrio marinus]
MNVLIVDPSSSYREVVKQILLGEDVEAIECVNGTEALAYLEKNKPDAISIAHELGDMESFAFLKKIKENSNLDNIPSFLLTSNTTQEFKRKAYDAGFTEVFIKSDFATLKRALRSLVLYATTNISARVLYIEDAQSTADYTTYIMKSAGWEVVHVKSGEEAAELLDDKNNRFDLVVTDLVLEGRISGIGLINLIRQGNEDIRNIPILAVSGWNDLLRQFYVLKHGAGDFIAKPFHETDFLARAINLILNKKKLDKVKATQKALYEKANIDAVTGLNNRHFMEEFGSKIVKDSIENNEGVALALLDIDHFKKINDGSGHSSGDEVLRQVASLIKSLRHPGDVVARFGGDEIILLMSGCEHTDVEERMEEIRTGIEKLSPLGIQVTASIGVACHDKRVVSRLVSLLDNVEQVSHQDVKVDFDVLFSAADHALYSAKRDGRNKVCISDLFEHVDV